MKARPKKSAGSCERAFLHTQQRVKERFNLDMQRHDYDWVLGAIRSKNCKTYKMSRTRVAHRVLYKEKWVWFVYSKSGCVLTALLEFQVYTPKLG